MNSMTGYASLEKVFPAYGQTVSLELKTLNSRYLEFKLKGPTEYSSLEPRILQEVKKYISRGFVELIISRERLAHSKASSLTMDDHGVKHAFQEIARVKRKFHIQGDITLDHLLSLPNIWTAAAKADVSADYWKMLSSLLPLCLKKVVVMRQKEGAVLKTALLKYLNELEEAVAQISQAKEDIFHQYERKLREKILKLTQKELQKELNDKSLDMARLHQEIAYLVERADISEELIRLQSHIQQFRTTSKQENRMGKNLDFLLQEMNREINTIGSKSLDLKISDLVIQSKSLLEKMREQVQNVE